MLNFSSGHITAHPSMHGLSYLEPIAGDRKTLPFSSFLSFFSPPVGTRGLFVKGRVKAARTRLPAAQGQPRLLPHMDPGVHCHWGLRTAHGVPGEVAWPAFLMFWCAEPLPVTSQLSAILTSLQAAPERSGCR